MARLSFPLRLLLVLLMASAVGSVWLVRAEREPNPAGWYRVIRHTDTYQTYVALSAEGRYAQFSEFAGHLALRELGVWRWRDGSISVDYHSAIAPGERHRIIGGEFRGFEKLRGATLPAWATEVGQDGEAPVRVDWDRLDNASSQGRTPWWARVR